MSCYRCNRIRSLLKTLIIRVYFIYYNNFRLFEYLSESDAGNLLKLSYCLPSLL